MTRGGLKQPLRRVPSSSPARNDAVLRGQTDASTGRVSETPGHRRASVLRADSMLWLDRDNLCCWRSTPNADARRASNAMTTQAPVEKSLMLAAPAAPIPTISRREPTLDGLRGVAVLMVVAYHAALFGGFTTRSRADALFNTVVRTGWMGVDLFFVLSGFLITGILRDSRGSERYFRTFYIRRFLRIVPACYAFLLLYLAVGPRILPSSQAPALSWRALVLAASYLSNYPTGLVGWAVLPHPLRHLWSLAVEEQFYLVWPLLVYALPARRLIHTCVGIVVTAWLVRATLATGGLPIAAYVWTPARLGPLALGSLLALVVREPPLLARMREWAPRTIVSILLLLLCVLLWRRNLSNEDLANQLIVFDAAAALFGAVIVVAITAAQRSVVHNALTSRSLRALGRYSYAMYLFHQPLILALVGFGLSPASFAAMRGSNWPGALAFIVICIGSSLLLAVLSWYVLEERFLRLKERFPYARRVVPGRHVGCFSPGPEQPPIPRT